jgi:hypothetical protein
VDPFTGQGTQAMQALQQMLQQMLQQLLQLMLHLLQLLECLCVIKVFLYFWHIHCSRVSQVNPFTTTRSTLVVTLA